MHSSAGEPAHDRPRGRVALRAGTVDDLDAVAQMHCGAIAEGFLSSLGPRFLARLYRRILRAPESFLFVADEEGAVAGFIAGSMSLGALYRSFVIRDGVLAALSAPGRVITSLPRVLETLRHGAAPAAAGSGELLAVAVGPAWRGQRIGEALVTQFLGELRRRGASAAHVVLGADNVAAVALYRASGFEPAHTIEMHKGTSSLLMARGLSADGAPPARAEP
jgi:ribosomal-protein-alanine N-acetyltransferase